MLNSAEEIIKYIGDAKKQTPVKVYLKGKTYQKQLNLKCLVEKIVKYVLVI